MEKKFLSPLDAEQIVQGNVTVANHYYRFNNMYRYFRERANIAYSQITKLNHSDTNESIKTPVNSYVRSQNEGFYNSLAMIDAFFSRLEHQLVLLLPFANFQPASDNLLCFIGSSWTEKYRRVLGIDPGSKAKQFYDQLDIIKERFRNTFTQVGLKRKVHHCIFIYKELAQFLYLSHQ